MADFPEVPVATGGTPRPAAGAQADDATRNPVRSAYAHVAQASDAGDGCGEASSCCGVSEDEQINRLLSLRLGYTDADLAAVPDGADMGLGCGNPWAIASLKLGETVLDLGAGGGFDWFLAAAGFVEVAIAPKDASRELIRDWVPGCGVEDYVVSATIEGRKPGESGLG